MLFSARLKSILTPGGSSSAINLGPSGTQIYRKRHLVPFGDYVPWAAELYGTVQRIPLSDTARGATEQPLPLLGDGRVAIAICYDDAFGSRMRADGAAAGWIANLSNDSWADCACNATSARTDGAGARAGVRSPAACSRYGPERIDR